MCVVITFREGFKQKKVGNLFMIFLQHPGVKLALFFDATRNNWAQEKGGTKAIKLNISQRIFGVLGF